MSQEKSKRVSFSDAPPPIQNIMIEAQEIQQTLASKLDDFEKKARENSVRAQKDVNALKADLEEIKKLATVNSKKADEELKAKIIKVNKKVDEIAKQATEEQAQSSEEYNRVAQELRTVIEEANSNMQKRVDVSPEDKKKFWQATQKYGKEALLRVQGAEPYRGLVVTGGVTSMTEDLGDGWESKKDVMKKVEYYLIVLCAQCPGLVIQGHKCPAKVARKPLKPYLRPEWQ